MNWPRAKVWTKYCAKAETLLLAVRWTEHMEEKTMDVSAFQKMKAKSGMTARVFNAHKGYPRFAELDWLDAGDADFIHLFVESSNQFKAFFVEVVEVASEKALVWVSYPSRW